MSKTGIEDSFYYNSMLAHGLAQFLPYEGRNLVRAWLQKLHEMPESTLRDEYLWFFLRVLHCRKSVAPFNSFPNFETMDDLLPIAQTVPQNILEDVLLSFEQEDYDWLNETKLVDCENVEEKKIAPSMFFDSLPRPKNGVFCYMAAFSDQEPISNTNINYKK